MSTPEVIHNISLSVHRAAAHAQNDVSTFVAQEPSKIPLPNKKQSTQKFQKKRVKLKQPSSLVTAPRNNLTNTPRLSSSRFVQPPARNLIREPSNTPYDNLADQVSLYDQIAAFSCLECTSCTCIDFRLHQYYGACPSTSTMPFFSLASITRHATVVKFKAFFF